MFPIVVYIHAGISGFAMSLIASSRMDSSLTSASTLRSSDLTILPPWAQVILDPAARTITIEGEGLQESVIFSYQARLGGHRNANAS